MHLDTKKLGFLSPFIFCILAACSTAKSQDTILPGLLDIPLVEGSTIPKDCKTEGVFEENIGTATCVLLKPEKDESIEGDGTRDWTTIYTNLLGEAEWRFVKPYGTHYLLQRPIKNTNCAEQLLFTWWPYGDYDEALLSLEKNNGADFDYATFTFTYLNEKACGDERLYKE